MHSLRNIQERCYRAFILGDGDPLLPDLTGGGIPARTSIQVYQNNALETYRKALLASYPIIERLVGEACFRGIAKKYMRDYPSTSGDLQNFGTKMPDFLHELYANTEFAYLPDVARLEWATEEVQLSRESDVLDIDALGKVAPERLTDVCFLRSESARLISSQYPILSIWYTNQPGQEADVDLDSGPEHVVVRRSADRIELNLIDPVAAALAAHLDGSRPLQAAIEALDPAVADSPNFDLASVLQQLTSTGIISSFTLPRPSSPQ